MASFVFLCLFFLICCHVSHVNVDFLVLLVSFLWWWRFFLVFLDGLYVHEIEDFEHRVLGCQYTSRIWNETFKISDKLNQGGQPAAVTALGKILCEGINNSIATFTIHAEILTRILTLKDEARYLIRPKIFVEQAIKYLIRREKGKLKDELKEALLED